MAVFHQQRLTRFDKRGNVLLWFWRWNTHWGSPFPCGKIVGVWSDTVTLSQNKNCKIFSWRVCWWFAKIFCYTVISGSQLTGCYCWRQPEKILELKYMCGCQHDPYFCISRNLKWRMMILQRRRLNLAMASKIMIYPASYDTSDAFTHGSKLCE